MSRQIVIAWIERDQLSASYGKPRAVMWMMNGTALRLRQARDYIRRYRPEGKIFVYPYSEQDPLGRARGSL